MGFLDKYLRKNFGLNSKSKAPKNPDDRLDDDLRQLLKKLPMSTKRNLIQDLTNTVGGSARGLPATNRGGKQERRASEPRFAVISEAGPLEDEKKEKSPKDYADSLVSVEDLPDLEDIKMLHKALKKADEKWVALFREARGMDGIFKAMAELAQSREAYLEDDGDDQNQHEVPEDEVKLEEELVHCIMVLLNKPQGLMTLEARSDLLPLLAGSAIDSSSNYVKCSLLKLLTIVAESGPSGFETVTNALDHVKVDKDDDNRFSLLVEAFGDADSSGVALVTDLIVFFNTILSSAGAFEERVMLRTEMIAAGTLEAMQRIRDYFSLSKDHDDEMTDDEWGEEEERRSRRSSIGSIGSDSSLSTLVMDAALTSAANELAAQLDLFDTVMAEDMKDAMSTGMTAEGVGEDVDGDGMGEDGGSVLEHMPDPPAVASMRSVIEKLHDNEETRLVVEIVAANMDRMVDIKCDDKQWKKLREVSRSALETIFMDSGSDSDDDDDGGFGGKPAPGNVPDTKIPPPASRSPAEAPKRAEGAPTPPPALPGTPRARSIPSPPPSPGMPGRGSIPPPLPERPSSGTIPLPAALPGVPAVRAAIPPPPPLPGMPRGTIPPPPPLPGMPGGSSIPTPPPLPGMPATPVLPGMPGGSSIPPPPPLPGMPRAAIPPPPALPGMPGVRGAIPPPPALLGMPAAPGGIPPPPALPGMKGGLPMPPPLPGMGGLRPPPPPMGMPMRGPAPPIIPAKPKGPKRRPVHWDKISPENLKETVFNDINPSSVNLPSELLGELAESFAEKPKDKKDEDKKREAGAAAEAAKRKKAARVELLDAKTLRNSGIAFKRFRMTPKDLRDSLVLMDLNKFDQDKFIALRNIAPTAEDLPKLKDYEGDQTQLDEVTLFMVLTAKIPRYTARLDCALFMKGFSGDAEFLTEKLVLVSLAVEEVVDSPRLKRLIEVVLAMGNYLNEGTRNGEAKAIRLASLLKLDTVKTMDKKKTLLHVLVGWAKEKEPSLLLLDEDLEHASQAMQWSLTDLKQQVAKLTKGFTLMQNQLKMAKDAANKLEGDKFVSVVEPFLQSAKDQMESLEAEYERVQGDYDDAARRFGEDPTKVPSGEFFHLVSDVLDMMAVASKENELQVKAEERRKKREAREKERRDAKAKKQLERSGRSIKGVGRGGGLSASRQSIRPSTKNGFGSVRGGLSGRGAPSGVRPLGIGINEEMMKRRNLLAAGPEDGDDDESDDEWDEQGAVQEEYDRIKNQRVNEAVIFRKISQLKDPSKRKLEYGQLPYQKSTVGLGRQQSMLRQTSGTSDNTRMAAAVRQASNLRVMAAVRQASNLPGKTARQASTVRFGAGGRRSSGLVPSAPGGGMGRPGLSTGRMGGGEGPLGLSRRDAPSDPNRMGMPSNPRAQFKTLKSTAFLG